MPDVDVDDVVAAHPCFAPHDFDELPPAETLPGREESASRRSNSVRVNTISESSMRTSRPSTSMHSAPIRRGGLPFGVGLSDIPRGATRSSQHRLGPGHQFPGTERLGDVVVGPDG